MKLKDGFLVHNTGDEQVIVGVGGVNFNGLVRSNPTAAFIVDCLKEETTESEIVDKMLEKYDALETVIECDVKRIVGQLREIGAIDE